MKPFILKQLIVVLILIGFSEAALAGVLYVDRNADSDGDGLTWGTAFNTIASALTAAGAGDEIWVAKGTYEENIAMAGGVSLFGGFIGSEDYLAQQDPEIYVTIINGSASGSCVTLSGVSDVVLDGLTITGGSADQGGGIYAENVTGSSSIVNCLINGNSATNNGGGIYCSTCELTIKDTTFDSNDVTENYGGGLYCSGSQVMLDSCTFSKNTANKYGGGICGSSESDITLTDCTFIRNESVEGYGGGMYCSESDFTLTNCTYTNNTVEMYGGGIYCVGSSLTLVNCTLSRNKATEYYGGGIFSSDSTLGLTNCTLSGNETGDYGGGIYNLDSEVTLTNCILWGDLSSGFGSEIYNIDSTVTISYCDVEGSGGSGDNWDTDTGVDSGSNIDANPIFAGSLDLHLEKNSPCIDAGSDADVDVNEDVDGDNRISGECVDMGSDEYVPEADTGLIVSPSGEVQVNDSVIFTVAAPESDGGNLYYCFYYRANYGADDYDSSPWVMMKNYSTSNTCIWSFSEVNNYIVVVRVTSDPDNEPDDILLYGQVVSVGTNPDLNISEFATSGDVALGSPVQIVANALASAADDSVYYKFYYCPNYGTDAYGSSDWTVMQDYSTSNSCSYTFPEANNYVIVVRAVTDPDNEPDILPLTGGVVKVIAED